jgi:hypothetical protein
VNKIVIYIIMPSLNKKLSISLWSALLFVLVSLPQTYKFTDSLVPVSLYQNCPTHLGLLLHTSVFFLLSYLSMGDPTKKQAIKLKFSLYGTLIFYFLSSPTMYALVGSLIKKLVSTTMVTASGCPKLANILLHSCVYTMALVGIMYLPEVKV